MSTGVPLKYIDDPQKYCNLVTELIEKANSEWQTVWRSAIIELFDGPQYNINSVNALLKVIEKAFKERRYHIRAQAFDCWQFFIKKVGKQQTCEKLLNVILIPLSASNHSMKIVLDAKLKAWLTLLQTSTLCKSISREKGIPSLLKILYGPHTLETASSYVDLRELCGTIYRLMVQKCLKEDCNNLILSYLHRALPDLCINQHTQELGKEIWIEAIEHTCSKKWPITLFNYLWESLEGILHYNNKVQREIFLRELLPILICEYNTYPLDHMMPHLNLLARCLFSSASCELNLSSTLEYLMKKFRKKEQILFDEFSRTLTKYAIDYREQLQKCWMAVVTCFCKWNKNEIESDNFVWILLFPVQHFHETWNSSIQDCMQTCFENMYSVSKVDTFIRNINRKLNTFLNKSENVPLSLLCAATFLCKVVLQKSRPSDNVSAIKDSLITIYEKLPSQTTVEETLICKYLSCVLYFMNQYPEYDHEFKPIICKYSECIDVNKDLKEYPVVQLLSKYTNNKPKEEEKLSNVLNIIRITPNKGTNQGFLGRLSPAESKSFSINVPKLQSGGTPKTPRQKFKDDNVEFVAIKSTPKNSPMTDHQREIAKEKSYIPAMYEDLSQSQSHSDSQSMLPNEKTLPPLVKVPSIDILEENAILPGSDMNADSVDEIPASLDFREVIRKDKLSLSFASKKSLFNDDGGTTSAPQTTKNSTQPSKRKSVRIESKVMEPATVKRARLSCPNRIQTTVVETSEKSSLLPPPPPASDKDTTKVNSRRKSVVEEASGNVESATSAPVIENESQTLFMPKTQSKSSSSSTPSSTSAEKKSVRRKSLKSKSSNAVPTRSPINTRKRKSVVGTTVDHTSKNTSAFEIEDSCSETDERSVKKEKVEEPRAEESHPEESIASSVVTVIPANFSASVPTDSVVIVEQDAEQQIIVIDSESPLSRSEAAVVDSSHVALTKPTVVDPKETAEEDETMIVENTQVQSDQIDGDRAEPVDVHDQSANESVKSASSSFNLALSESVRADDDSGKQLAEAGASDVVEKTVEPQQPSNEQPEPVVSNETASNLKKVEEEETAKANSENGAGGDEEAEPNAAESAVSTGENVNASVSPLSGSSRGLQMLQMVYNGSSNLTRPKNRFRANTRSPGVSTSPANNRTTANGVAARTPINSRHMKMLQFNNGHVENAVKASPNNMVNLVEKIEKFRYVPKECTSPSILKKPNLNGTMSPRSPKSVNFAERLTNTREYNVETGNLTDSWSSAGSQGDNLISDDEATSQESLYPCLHNCTDDIKNITERLTMNQQQLDTLKRMGIETVGQLASVSTIVGKSIPVGDNRIQRLRNALQAYDNDRKLKGLRAPSVRRKIMYKSPVEVSSIIEILDDECEVEAVSEIDVKCENADKLTNDEVDKTLTVALEKLPASAVVAFQNGSPSNETSSPVGETQRCSSPVGQTQRHSSPTKMTQTQVSPTKNEPAVAPSSPVRVTTSVTDSPAKREETTSSDKATDSPLKSSEQPPNSLGENLSRVRSTTTNEVDDRRPSSPVTEERTSDENTTNKSDASTDVIESKNGVVEIDETVAEEAQKENEDLTAVNQTANNSEFWKGTQDDDQDFICTNHEESVFTNGDRRTYSKLMKRMTTSMPVVHAADVTAKFSSPETSVSQVSASVNESKDERAEETCLMEEQQSVSIFSSEPAKNVEDMDDVSTSQEVETTSMPLNVAVIEDEVPATPSISKMETVSPSEELSRVSAVTENSEGVCSALLQRVLQPYLGPACLSQWSNETASRVELRRIIESLVEGFDSLQTAGLIDSEKRNILRQINDLVDNE